MKVKNEAPEFELLDEDTYPARCRGYIDLGTQTYNPKYGSSHRIRLVFEVIDEEKEDGSPFVLGLEVAVKFSSRADLAKLLKRWLGIVVARDEEFDFDELIDQPAMITVEHSEENDNGDVFANIVSVTKVPKGVKVGKAVTDEVAFSLDDFDEDVFDELPEWIQKKIKNSDEYQEMFGKKKKSKRSRDDEDEDEEDERPRKSKKRSRDDEDEDDDEEDEDERPRKSKRKSKAADDEDEDDDEDERPRKRSKVKDEDEDEDEDEEDEDEQPRKRAKKPVKKPAKKTARKLPKRKK